MLREWDIGIELIPSFHRPSVFHPAWKQHSHEILAGVPVPCGMLRKQQLRHISRKAESVRPHLAEVTSNDYDKDP
jgi:hypothetical protein